MLETGSIERPRPIANAIRSMLQNEDLHSVALDLRPQLEELGLTDADRIIIENLPIGGALTIGQCKAGRSWTILPHEVDSVGFIAPADDGRTYALTVCVIAPDPSDHGLAKTKGQFTLPVTAPLPTAPATLLLKNERAAAADPATNVIPLPADAAQAAWQEETARQVAEAEARLKAKQQEQLAKIEELLATEDAARTSAVEAKWRAEVERQVAAAEARLTARHKEQLSAMETRWRARQAMRPSSADVTVPSIDEQLAEARQQWRAEQTAARREWEAETERRLADARNEWQIAEARRAAALRESWQAEIAAQHAADEPARRAEIER